MNKLFRIRTAWNFIFLLVLALQFGTQAQQGEQLSKKEKEKEAETAHTIFIPSNAEEGKKLAEIRKSVYEVRDQQIFDLEKILQTSTDDKWSGAKYLAAEMLGVLRARQAVALLANDLTFLPTGPRIGNMGIESQSNYICAWSLVQIGEPSIGIMMARIQSPSPLEERQLAAWVIMRIEGPEQAVFRLQREAKREIPKDQKANFLEMADYIQNFKISVGFPGEKNEPLKRVE